MRTTPPGSASLAYSISKILRLLPARRAHELEAHAEARAAANRASTSRPATRRVGG